MLDVRGSRFEVSPSASRRACAAGHSPFAIRHSPFQRGIALVITLILLSVTLVMAVAFLAIANRERNAVTTTADTATARHAAETALAYAEAQIVANILSTTNAAAYNFNLLVSTNYINAFGFDPGSGNPTNVNYDYLVSGGPLTTASQRNQNIANLWFLPRAPVFITTNRATGSNDFRYYLDLNRSARFDANGPQPQFGRTGGFLHPDGTEDNNPANVLTNFMTGDPEWIGILERPDAPHGPNNKFVARVAFLAQPIGNSLDLNYIHNQAHLPLKSAMNASGADYMRNEGVGSWEINLGAFLFDLNTNTYAWGFYTYDPQGAGDSGNAFIDALALYRYRLNGPFTGIFANDYAYNAGGLNSVNNLFGANGNNAFGLDLIDGYSDGPLMTTNTLPFDNDSSDINRPWPGADNTNHFFALPSELFDPGKSSGGPTGGFTNRLRSAGNGVSTYDRYTFYRMLDQLGTDSTADSGKMNLNYDNLSQTNFVSGSVSETNFFRWQPLAFFTNAADRMLRTDTANWFASNPTNYLVTYYGYTPVNYVGPDGYGLTNFPYSGKINQVPAFGLGNIPVFVYGQFVYSPAVNRVLQLAANIYDASTTNFFPSVFRPTFLVTNEFNYRNVYINGYEVVSQNSPTPTITLTVGTPPLDRPEDVALLAAGPLGSSVANYPNGVNVYGVPWIIGAKKGLPNFNLLSMVNSAQVTRKLMVSRTSTNPATATYATNQMYVMSITNNIGVSFWNSYAADYTNRSGQPITVYVSDWLDMTLTNGVSTWSSLPVQFTMSRTINPGNSWPGSQWSGQPPNATINGTPFIATNWTFAFLPESVYLFSSSFSPVATWQTTTPPLPPLPQFGLMTTNRLQAMILDGNNVIDYVQLRGPINNRDLSAELADLDYAVGDNIYYQWSTNGPSAAPPNYGVLNQLAVSKNSALAPLGNSWINRPPGMPSALGSSKEEEAAFFRGFFAPSFQVSTGGPTYVNTQTNVQAPYTPSRTIYDYTLWGANDPLVHYLANDLNYVSGGIPAVGLQKNDDGKNMPTTSDQSASIGNRYQPWGRSKQMAGLANVDKNAFNLAYKDPLVWGSDNWDFPTNQYPTVGWIGRVHRGTPWQTVYLKATNILNYAVSGVSGLTTWVNWSGDANSFDAANAGPTQDHLLFDLFTTSFNDNAVRGTLSVNQVNLAAWSAVFSGMVALTNNVVLQKFMPSYTSLIINPAGVAGTNSPLGQIVNGVGGINAARAVFTNTDGLVGAFEHIGDILSVPVLTEQSPFLNWNDKIQQQKGISDEVYEWLPQQMMSLLRCPTGPRYVIYCYGQTLKPAQNGLVTSSSTLPSGLNPFGMVTNYQVVAESAVRAVVSVHPHMSATSTGFVTNYTITVESYIVLPPD